MKEENTNRVVRTYCRCCYMDCGIRVHVKDGKAVKVEGDPEYPLNEGRICIMTRNFIEGTLYNANRLKYPMRRAGEKGQGKWERISWEEALDEIADKLLQVREKYSPLSLAAVIGGQIFAPTCQLMRSLGSPNLLPNTAYCEGPATAIEVNIAGSTFTQFGRGPDCRSSKCILLWGNNPVDTHPPQWYWIREAMSNGAKLIVVDPRKTTCAAKADIWLQPRPGTDGALALAMLNVIINEELYDKDFVSRWCFGFEKLHERVQEYPPERVEEITWIPAAKIREVARIYATTRPASIASRIGVMQQYGSCGTAHSQDALIAITGNLDIEGGNLLLGDHLVQGYISAHDFVSLSHPELLLPEEIAAQRIGANEYPLWCGPNARVCAAHLSSVVKAMLTGKPYPIKGLVVHGENMVVQYPNAKEVYEALKNLDLLVVINWEMTPTTELADYVLPSATWMERDEITLGSGVWLPCLAARVKAVEPVGESRSDFIIALQLAKKLQEKGLEPAKSRTGEPFQTWETHEEFMDYCLKGAGLSWAELKEKSFVEYPLEYKRYEKEGFKTPSGKFEIYSTMLEKVGQDPLPYYVEPPESYVSTPELAKEYPLILTTARVRGNLWMHSGNRWASWARKIKPAPECEINPHTANNLGVKNGDWLWIETPRDKIRHKAKVTNGIHPKVVSVEPGWYYPEKGAPLYGAFDSNINVISPNDRPYNPIVGNPQLRAMLCKVYKAEEANPS